MKQVWSVVFTDFQGGRMSVCSAIGMVPCAFAQINFEEFLKGQSHM
jgi:glucose-6-phosphate isomerase